MSNIYRKHQHVHVHVRKRVIASDIEYKILPSRLIDLYCRPLRLVRLSLSFPHFPIIDELPVSCADAVSKFVDSEAFFERACSQLCVLGCRTEEHGLCYKRMYFELKAQELFHTHENNLPRAKAEMIFMLKLACAQDFPLGEICAQLPNLNTLEIKYDLVASPRPEAYLECVPRAL